MRTQGASLALSKDVLNVIFSSFIISIKIYPYSLFCTFVMLQYNRYLFVLQIKHVASDMPNHQKRISLMKSYFTMMKKNGELSLFIMCYSLAF